MGALVHDVRCAARAFLRSPGLWSIAAITLALGIGANTAVFSVVHAVLLKPLPYRDPSRLIVAWDTYLPQDKLLPMFPKIGVAPPELELWRQQNDIFEDTAWYRYVAYEMVLTAPGAEALSIHAGFCSSNFFRVLGVAPALGRSFADDEPPSSVLISDRFWRAHFAADPGVTGRAIRLNDQVFTVTGVMPPGFSFPEWTDLWLPPGPLYGDELTNPVRHAVGFIGRLNPDVTAQQATTRLRILSARLAREHPSTSTGWGMRVSNLQDDLTRKEPPRLFRRIQERVERIPGVDSEDCSHCCTRSAGQSSTFPRRARLTRASGRSREIAIRTSFASTNALPLSPNHGNAGRFNVPGNPVVNPDSLPAGQLRWVSPDYFRVMGIPLRSGRSFDGRILHGPQSSGSQAM